MQKITFQASQVELSAVQSNDIYMSVLMRMFSTRPKDHGLPRPHGQQEHDAVHLLLFRAVFH